MDDRQRAAGLLRSIEGLDLDSADGRAGLTAVLAEIEAAEPGALKRLLADIQLRKLERAGPTAH